MRTEKRIPEFLKLINMDMFCDTYGIPGISKLSRKTITYWKKNPDMRFGQMLINLGLAPDSMRLWADEDDMILINQGHPPENVLFWGQNYDKNGDRLPAVNWVLISKMNTDHIKKVLAFMTNRLPARYQTAFSNELQKRGA